MKLVLRQDAEGNVYGRPELVYSSTVEDCLVEAYGPEAPLDAKLYRALIFEVITGTAVPTVVDRPRWSAERMPIGLPERKTK